MPSEAARHLVDARHQRRRLPGLPPELRPTDIHAAYAVQAEAQALLRAASGATEVGYKIGCTTPVMPAFLGIDAPCSGSIAGLDVYASPARLRYADFLHVGVECELAVRLRVPLRPEGMPFTRESVAAAVGACMAAIEVVDDRWDDYRAVDTNSLVADNFFHAGCVLGPEVTDWRRVDLAAVTGTTTIDGTEMGRGRSSDVMGHPFEALAWLANALGERGTSLPAGAIVLTGSVVETRWVSPGAHVVAELGGLGRAEVLFAE